MKKSQSVAEGRNVLGVFLKQPVAGLVKTRLAKTIGKIPAASLYECFIKDTLQLASDLPVEKVIGYSEQNSNSDKDLPPSWLNQLDIDDWDLWIQPATSLGGRMGAFFEHCFCEQNGRQVVLIGSDTPNLPEMYLHEAFRYLEQTDCVLGPSTDGGYYLVGLSEPTAVAGMFEQVEWSGPSVLSQTVRNIESLGLSLSLLPVWYDVDEWEDLQALQGHLRAEKHMNNSVQAIHTWDWLQQEMNEILS